MKKIALLFFAAASTLALASDKEVEALLKKMREAYRDIGTATFTMESTIQGQNGDVLVKMGGGFKSPNLMYVDIKAEEVTAKIVCDGTKIYLVSDAADRVLEIPYNVDNMGQVLSGANLELINLYDWKRQLSTAEGDNMHDSKLSIRKNQKWNGKSWTVLEESAPTVGVYVEYYIDPKTNLVWRTVQMSLDKEFTRGDFVIKTLKPGAKVDDKKFKKPIITSP